MIPWRTGPRHQGLQKTGRARELRQKSTDAEKRIWHLLRSRQLLDWKFRRQVPHGNYYLDFYCAKAKLAVELDGGQHYEGGGRQRDERRDAYLGSEGITVLRYSDRDCLLNPERVLEDILNYLDQSSPQPSPFQGEGDRGNNYV